MTQISEVCLQFYGTKTKQTSTNSIEFHFIVYYYISNVKFKVFPWNDYLDLRAKHIICTNLFRFCYTCSPDLWPKKEAICGVTDFILIMSTLLI